MPIKENNLKMKYISSKNNVNSDENSSGILNDKSFQILKLALDEIKEKYSLSSGEIMSLMEEKKAGREILVPVSVFGNDKLSALESVCKYLKEEFEFSFVKIASLLNRDSRTVWATYRNSLRNVKEKLIVTESRYFVPVSVFTNRKLSVLEAIVGYLKDRFELRYSEIALLLNRDERNVWAVYAKFRKKNERK